jgi:hypothetical protein
MQMSGCQLRSAAVALAGGLLVALVTGCGGRTTHPAATTLDSPTVFLGSYRFASNSQYLTHPDFTVNPNTPTWLGSGYGDCSGKTLTILFAAGGQVQGVRTVEMTLKIPFPSEPTQRSWLAQDTRGSIHHLQIKSGTQPAHLVGVANNPLPWFWLPRPAQTTLGRTWYWMIEDGSERIIEYEVLSTSASWRGRTGLLHVRTIEDTNDDEIFQTKWTGPDKRRDIYFNPGSHAVYGFQVTATGGYVRS